MSLKSGDLVKVKIFGGAVVKRRLLRVAGQVAVLTTPEESEAAANEQREPICIGFPLSDVSEVREESAKAPPNG